MTEEVVAPPDIKVAMTIDKMCITSPSQEPNAL
jgi:hypothetical protein